MTIRSAAALVPCLLLAAVAAGLPAQALAPEQPAFHPERLEVKLAEGSGAEWRGGALVSHTGVDLRDVQRRFGDARVEPLFTALDWQALDALHDEVCGRLDERDRPGHLGLWFRLRFDDADRAAAAKLSLQASPLVAHVYHEPIFYPASAALPAMPTGGDVPPTTPAFMSMQVAHGPTPDGHGIRLCASVLGARGRGQAMRMIETSWLFDHEDVSQLVAGNMIGPVPTYDQTPSLHGLSGASIVIADRNAYGVTGIADEVEAKFISLSLTGGLENAILLAMNNSQEGDVLMIVIMALIPALGPGSFLPIEFYQSVFDVMRTVTANERHVVVPAGNGNRSLDDPVLLGRFDRNFRDSGAIISGASNGVLLEKASFSNWGSRIDAHGLGNNVVSCGYGGLWIPGSDLTQSYTDEATGTSSSTPHLAGLVMAIQGAARWQLGQVLSNQQIVDLINGYGPSTPDVIGVRPDLVAIFESLGIFDGLRLSQPDVDIGDTVDIVMAGADGAIVALFGGFGVIDVPVGLNRNLHLDPAGMASIGAFQLVNGQATMPVPVPNDPSLHGADLFFQAVRLDGGAPLHLTNSCQVTIL